MKLLIVDHLAKDFKEALEPKFPEVTFLIATKTEDVENQIEMADILLTMGPAVIRISDEIIKKAVRLQWIQSAASGVDFIFNLPSLKREVIVTSTRGIHGPQVSELAFLFMLSFNINFPYILRNQDKKVWERWKPGHGQIGVQARILNQKKVGILGLGAIGEEIARKCKVFGMTVYGIARSKKLAHTVDYLYGPENLNYVLKEVDYFINVVPSTPQTQKMIGKKEFSLMKPTAFFINIGRGSTVDEPSMIEALQEGIIAGAGLDTFSSEPLPMDSPLWKMKNVMITPHIGGQCDMHVEQVLSIFEENLRRFLQGEKKNLINLIDR